MPEGALRQALAAEFGHAVPRAGGWQRLRQRAAEARRTPVALPPVFNDFDGALAHAHKPLALQSSSLVWRLPWRSSFSACPLL